MMITIGLISRKGGVGKTTLALNAACALQTGAERALILDMDDQGSCWAWDEARGQPAAGPAVQGVSSRALERTLALAKEELGIAWTLCDTPSVVDAPAHAVAACADLILIPAQPTLLDQAAIGHTLRICALAAKPAWVVLNRCDGRTRERELAEAQLAGLEGLQLCPVTIGSRVAYRHAYAAHASVLDGGDSRARREIEDLAAWLRRERDAGRTAP